MTRRDAIGALAAAGSARSLWAHTDLAKLFADAQGTAVVLDYRTKRIVASHRLDTAARLVVAPGSVLKPLTILALLEAGKLRASEAFPCSGQLKIAGSSFACAHPRIATPIDVSAAIAYSCNEFVARVATRFKRGELADAFALYGLTAPTHLAGYEAEAAGHAEATDSIKAAQLQALGEQHVTSTVFGMVGAYHKLAGLAALPQNAAIMMGLEGAVDFGTAQHAAVPGLSVAGKTGSAPGRWAWFGGFAPSRNPQIVVTVLVQGRAGGADAAPIAGHIFAAYKQGRL